MRTSPRTLTTLLVLTAFSALGAISSADALAETSGGAAAPAPEAAATTTPAPAAVTGKGHRIHPSGIATWFGPGFYGRETACGQTLTPLVVGVANRTLPCGTLVQVTYDGRSLTVPVLDRGPYSHIGADWDLTAGAAEALGISETVRIKTRLIGAAPNTPTLGLPVLAPTSVLAGGAVAG
jgi:rare lipoprotein A (peptidoglycan hydrolase)